MFTRDHSLACGETLSLHLYAPISVCVRQDCESVQVETRKHLTGTGSGDMMQQKLKPQHRVKGKYPVSSPVSATVLLPGDSRKKAPANPAVPLLELIVHWRNMISLISFIES